MVLSHSSGWAQEEGNHPRAATAFASPLTKKPQKTYDGVILLSIKERGGEGNGHSGRPTHNEGNNGLDW